MRRPSLDERTQVQLGILGGILAGFLLLAVVSFFVSRNPEPGSTTWEWSTVVAP